MAEEAATTAKSQAQVAGFSLGKVADGLVDVGGWFAAACLIGITAIVLFEVVMRYIFNSPTTWSLEVTEYLLVMGTFLGSAYVLKEKRHVIIDLLTSQLVGRTRAMVEIVNIVALLFFFRDLAVVRSKGISHRYRTGAGIAITTAPAPLDSQINSTGGCCASRAP